MVREKSVMDEEVLPVNDLHQYGWTSPGVSKSEQGKLIQLIGLVRKTGLSFGSSSSATGSLDNNSHFYIDLDFLVAISIE